MEFLRVRNITAQRWSMETFDVSGKRELSQNTTIWCAEGSLTLQAGEATFSMQPGDALHIPADTIIEAKAGISGCVCYENTRQQTL